MGYNTDFRLEVLVQSIDFYRKLLEGKRHDSLFEWLIYEGGYFSSTTYDPDESMLQASIDHPNEVFVLYGSGEESNDLWRTVYYSGEKYHVVAQIVYPITILPNGVTLDE